MVCFSPPGLPLGPTETAGGTSPFSGPCQVLASPCSCVSFINLVPREAPPLLKSSCFLGLGAPQSSPLQYLPNSESFRLGEHPRPLLKDGRLLTGVPGTLGFLDVFLLSSFLCSYKLTFFFFWSLIINENTYIKNWHFSWMLAGTVFLN